MKMINGIALLLVIVGAVNWGLARRRFEFNLVSFLFGPGHSAFPRIIYSLVGISGLIALTFFGRLGE